MHIEHVALWTNDLERCIEFYRQYFGATPGARYVNAKKGFESTFLQFPSGARLEVMKTSTLDPVVLEAGAQRAKDVSAKTLKRVYDRLGFLAPRA